jgi:hypothetical protein
MPDWVLTMPRLALVAAPLAARRIRRYAVDRQALVREGSAAATPVIQFTKTLGPLSVTWGPAEENRAKLQERYEAWPELRDALATYANQHPSDRVRKLGQEVETAVAQDLHHTAFLLGSQRTDTPSRRTRPQMLPTTLPLRRRTCSWRRSAATRH